MCGYTGGSAGLRLDAERIAATKSSEEASAPNDPTGPPSSSKPYLVYSCCGDKAVLPLWLRNGPRQFDLWATYYGSKEEDPAWKNDVDTFRRRKGGSSAGLCREPCNLQCGRRGHLGADSASVIS